MPSRVKKKKVEFPFNKYSDTKNVIYVVEKEIITSVHFENSTSLSFALLASRQIARNFFQEQSKVIFCIERMRSGGEAGCIPYTNNAKRAGR